MTKRRLHLIAASVLFWIILIGLQTNPPHYFAKLCLAALVGLACGMIVVKLRIFEKGKSGANEENG
jgi:hypothetical protein